MGYATELHRSALFVGGLLLLVAVMLLVGGVAWGERHRHAAP
jgi:hypothetical protein